MSESEVAALQVKPRTVAVPTEAGLYWYKLQGSQAWRYCEVANSPRGLLFYGGREGPQPVAQRKCQWWGPLPSPSAQNDVAQQPWRYRSHIHCPKCGVSSTREDWEMTVIQPSNYNGESRKACAIIEVNGTRFFSVTPGSTEQAEKINNSLT